MANPATGNRRTLGRIGLVVLAIGFIVAVAAVNVVFKGVRLDLTENRLYTLSEGTRKVLADIPEPVNVYFFWSDRATTSIPYLQSYAARVQEMLEEFASRSNGRLRVTVVDPQPFSEDEDRAAQFGLQPANLPTTPEPVYLGVAGTNSVGDQEIIPFLDPGKEQFLEYDLAKLVYSLARPQKPVVGLLAGLPVMAGFDPVTQQMREPYAIAGQLQQLFDLRVVGEDGTGIDPDVQVLLVVHPKDLGDAALYAIDQFVLRGGKAYVFFDPFAEIDPGNPLEPPGPGSSKASDLGRLLDAWGVTVDPEKFVADDRFALTVGGLTARPVRHLGILGIEQDSMDQDDVVTGGLGVVNLAFAGHIARKEGATTEVVPLVRSSTSAALIPTSRLAFLPDPALLRDDFAPTGERYTLAARLRGKVRTAFPDGPPPGAAAPGTHLTESAAPVDLLLVADADVVADRLWVQSQNFLGQRIAQAFANNGDLVINGVDNLLGSSDLISIRSRATFSRPFARVLELRRAAEARLVQSEEALQQELRDTEARLTELQAARQDGVAGSLLLSPEQQREIERFQARRLDIRKELRQVQRSLDQDIERLGNLLKAINIAGMPLLISLLSIALYLGRRRRSRAMPEVRP